MTPFPRLKARLIAYNNRQMEPPDWDAQLRARETAAREAGAAETAAAIAAVIADRVPPPRAHICDEPGAWCLDCTRLFQARADAAIALEVARQIGGAA